MISSKNFVFGDQTEEVPAHLNFGKYIFQSLLRHKEKIALINAQTDEKMTYKKFAQLTANMSVSFSKLGMKKGYTVAICGDKRNDFLPTALAVICTGAAFTPIDINCGRAVLRHKLSITKPEYIISTDGFWNTYHETLTTMDFIKMYITFEKLPETAIRIQELTKDVDIDYFEPAEIEGQSDTAIVLYSSGTTGMPKGVMLTHLNAILASKPHTCFIDHTINRYILSGDWFHNYCLFITFTCLSAGKITIFSCHNDTEKMFAYIEKYKAEMYFTTPVSITNMSKHPDVEKYDLGSLRLLYSRSFPLHAKTIKVIKERIPTIENVMQGYGMTESGEPTSESRGEKGPKTGSVGVPCPTITIKVVDTQTRESLGPNQSGEICVRGAVFMKGYLGVDTSDYLDKEGFFKTGDLGYYDEDNYFYIAGRLKDIIKYQGYQVPPLELETLLLQHPDVKDAGVIGVPDPNIPENHLPMAFVVKRRASTVTELELADYVAAEVSTYMKLTGGVKFISKIPRNSRGKILRNTLLDMYTTE